MIEEVKMKISSLTNSIREIDKMNTFCNETLKRRNQMVEEVRELNRLVPPGFSEGERVIVKLKRHIKGIVKEVKDPEQKRYLIKPDDTMYSEPFTVTEELLTKTH